MAGGGVGADVGTSRGAGAAEGMPGMATGCCGAVGGSAGATACWKEPIGGGAVDTGGAGTTGAEAGAASIPGGGGAMEAGTAGAVAGAGTAGAAIWPISGTALGCAGGTGTETGTTVLRSSGFLAIMSFAATPICTTASRPSTPQAMTEARSRSGDRMVEGGVTRLLEKGRMVRSGPPSVNAPGFFVQNAGRSHPAAVRSCFGNVTAPSSV